MLIYHVFKQFRCEDKHVKTFLSKDGAREYITGLTPKDTKKLDDLTWEINCVELIYILPEEPSP
jgi:hypothetical protein